MKLTIVGSGDAFGSGGRLQTCYHVATSDGELLIDCGATALIGLNRLGLDPNRIGIILVSHLHGDHFAGLVWWMLHAVHVAKRDTPLLIVGPAGIEARYVAAAEALFPGASATRRRFDLRFAEFQPEQPLALGNVRVTPFEVCHPSGAPPYALRIEADGRTLAFSGDTEWVDCLIRASDGADLFLCECYAFDGTPRYHMSWRVIEQNLDRLTAKRVLLTHMSTEMLANGLAVADPRVDLAEDGLSVVV
jgi:ribonuclease BN (tRNA processing enzyme)